MKLKFAHIALAFSLTAAAVGAQASVIGMADLSISNLILRNATTGIALTAADINITGGDRLANSLAVLNGVSASNQANAGATGSADAAMQCLGACGNANLLAAYASGGGLSENKSTHILSPIVPGVNYALGDSSISGNAISGGAAGFTRADAQVSGPTNMANANGNLLNNVTAKSTFASNVTVTADFLAIYDAYVGTYIDPEHYGVNGVSSSSATNQFTLTVYDETAGAFLVMGSGGNTTWSPADLNRSATTSTANNGAAKSIASNGAVDSNDVLLIAGHDYTLTITQNSTVNVKSIPEPTSVALFGLALLGLGVARRRKSL